MDIGAGTDVALARSGGIDVFVIGAAEGAITAEVGCVIEVDVETGGVVDVDVDAVAALALVTLSTLFFSSSSSSSSCGFRRSEISTLAVGGWGLVCTDIICAVFLFRYKFRGTAAQTTKAQHGEEEGTMNVREIDSQGDRRWKCLREKERGRLRKLVGWRRRRQEVCLGRFWRNKKERMSQTRIVDLTVATWSG